MARTVSESGLSGARRLLEGFGATLRITRKAEGISTRALADELGIRVDVLNRIEKSVWMPSEEDERVLREWMLQHALPLETD